LEHFLHMASLNYHPQCVILIGECFLLSFWYTVDQPVVILFLAKYLLSLYWC
jgi:hypothetical protein